MRPEEAINSLWEERASALVKREADAFKRAGKGSLKR